MFNSFLNHQVVYPIKGLNRSHCPIHSYLLIMTSLMNAPRVMLCYYQNKEEDKHDLSCSVVSNLRLDKEVAEVELTHHHGKGAHKWRQRVGKMLVVTGQDVKAKSESDNAAKRQNIRDQWNHIYCLKTDLSWSEIYCISNHTSFF